jgi:hypothetical protein
MIQLPAVLFSHPAVTTLTMWGFWDTSQWKKNAVMYRGDWSLEPGGQAYRDLVFGKWRTQEQGTTPTPASLRSGVQGNWGRGCASPSRQPGKDPAFPGLLFQSWRDRCSAGGS